MREFTFLDLQQQSEEIQRSAASSPVLILNPGKPSSVMMSVEEFRRLKLAAGDTLPSEVAKPRAIVRRGALKDPWDTTLRISGKSRLTWRTPPKAAATATPCARRSRRSSAAWECRDEAVRSHRA